MVHRLVLGVMLLIAGFVFGWQMRGEMAIGDCARAGGAWVEPGVCVGVRPE